MEVCTLYGNQAFRQRIRDLREARKRTDPNFSLHEFATKGANTELRSCRGLLERGGTLGCKHRTVTMRRPFQA